MEETVKHYNSIVDIIQNCTDDIFDILNLDINNWEVWSEVNNRLSIFALEFLYKKS